MMFLFCNPGVDFQVPAFQKIFRWCLHRMSLDAAKLFPRVVCHRWVAKKWRDMEGVLKSDMVPIDVIPCTMQYIIYIYRVCNVYILYIIIICIVDYVFENWRIICRHWMFFFQVLKVGRVGDPKHQPSATRRWCAFWFLLWKNAENSRYLLPYRFFFVFISFLMLFVCLREVVDTFFFCVFLQVFQTCQTVYLQIYRLLVAWFCLIVWTVEVWPLLQKLCSILASCSTVYPFWEFWAYLHIESIRGLDDRLDTEYLIQKSCESKGTPPLCHVLPPGKKTF